MYLHVIFILALWMPIIEVQCKGVEVHSKRARQLEKLKHYEIIVPHRLDGRHRREANTLTQDGHLNEASFLLPAFGKEYVLDVRLNENLFPKRYVETHITEDGHVVTKLPHKHHHCYYHGEVREGNISSVAISTCNGLSGMVHVDGEALAVEPLEGSPRQHVVYHQKDVVSNGEKLVMDMKYESVGELPDISSKQRHRRDILSETKYVELAIVNDDAEFRLRGGIAAVQERSKQLVNAMDMLYRALNVRIALVNVEVWTSPQIEITHDATANLGRFQIWRKELYSPRMHNDNAQLITGIPFQDSIVGMAEHGKMCTEDKSCGVNTDIELELSKQV
eukprot:XP_011662406.1 PREDICTED: disintegrin and metalloproteinase domain-containing protein 12 isoform X1 [Strongylocentrotus purpuratus]